MIKNNKKLHDLIGNYPLSQRISFFLNELEISDDFIIKKTTDVNGNMTFYQTVKKICSGRYDDKFMNNKRILDFIKKLNRLFFKVPLEWILVDYGKEWRMQTLLMKRELKEGKYFGDFSLDEIEKKFDNYNDVTLNLFDDIKEAFSKKLSNNIERYKLIKYYDFYIDIEETVWLNLLCNKTLLNEKGLEELERQISYFKNINIIDLQIEIFNKIVLLKSIQNESDEKLKKELSEEAKKEKINNSDYLLQQLEMKVKDNTFNDNLKIYRRMTQIVTMDKSDFDLLIMYYSNLQKPTAQNIILDCMEKLCFDAQYSNLSLEKLKRANKEDYEFEYDDCYDKILDN